MEVTIVNVSVGNVFVDWANDVSSASSILLTPNGGSLVMLADEDGELLEYELVGIAPTGPLNVAVWEVIRV